VIELANGGKSFFSSLKTNALHVKRTDRGMRPELMCSTTSSLLQSETAGLNDRPCDPYNLNSKLHGFGWL
jgi:hypothetical protein